MLRVSLRNLLARKARLFLSAFAIVLGVAFVAGSMVFTDAMSTTFDDIIEGSLPDTTVRPIGSTTVSIEGAFNFEDRVVTEKVVDTLRKTRGLEDIVGRVQGSGLSIVRKDGKHLGGVGAPTIAFNYTEARNTRGEKLIGITAGRPPRNEGEVAFNVRSVEKSGYEIGDTVSMVTSGKKPKLKAELVGITNFTGGGLAGATIVYFDTKTAQDIFLDGQDAFSHVRLLAEPGVSAEQLTSSTRQLIPNGLEAVSYQQMVDESKDLSNTALKFLSAFLFVFAGIALVVGAFLIINTFSILVAQRSRELAVLRALGASRRQVTSAVLIEALVIGIVGSTLGLLAGLLLASGLKAVFGIFGLDLSGSSLRLEPQTVMFSYGAGILITVAAAYLPARRAAMLAPVAAMRDDVAMPESSLRMRFLTAITLAPLAVMMVGVGLFGDLDRTKSMGLVGAGIFTLLTGVVLFGPIVAPPFLRVLGVGFRAMFRVVGNLATQNAQRNPRRTAATAAALMIGIALVTTMSVLGASINKSMEVSAKKGFRTDFLVSNAIGQPFSMKIGTEIGKLDGVGRAARQQTALFRIDGALVIGLAVDFAPFDAINELAFESGSPGLEAGEIALDESTAEKFDVGVDDALALVFDSGTIEATVVGIYEGKAGVGPALVPFATIREAGLKRADTAIRIDAAPGVEPSLVSARIARLLDDYPAVTVQNQAEHVTSQRAQINRILYLIYALLGLAVAIAILGIINTLALSVVERTREIGLLRAVGIARSQLRRMVRLEAIAIAVLGALLGILAGVAFGAILQRAAQDEGIADLAIPSTQLASFVLIAALVGVVAAVLPSRRAANLDVLNAIATE